MEPKLEKHLRKHKIAQDVLPEIVPTPKRFVVTDCPYSQLQFAILEAPNGDHDLLWIIFTRRMWNKFAYDAEKMRFDPVRALYGTGPDNGGIGARTVSNRCTQGEVQTVGAEIIEETISKGKVPYILLVKDL